MQKKKGAWCIAKGHRNQPEITTSHQRYNNLTNKINNIGKYIKYMNK